MEPPWNRRPTSSSFSEMIVCASPFRLYAGTHSRSPTVRALIRNPVRWLPRQRRVSSIVHPQKRRDHVAALSVLPAGCRGRCATSVVKEFGVAVKNVVAMLEGVNRVLEADDRKGASIRECALLADRITLEPCGALSPCCDVPAFDESGSRRSGRSPTTGTGRKRSTRTASPTDENQWCSARRRARALAGVNPMPFKQFFAF